MTPRQTSLFDAPATRGFTGRRDSQTQRDAAHAVKAAPAMRVVLLALSRHGALTVDGIAEVTDGYAPSIDRRVAALVTRGWVQATGATALTRRNRQAALFALTDAGRDAVRAIRGAA